MAAVCESCLSSGRLLSRVQPELRRLLAAVLSDAEQDLSASNMELCWECAALLGRVAQFRRRAARAREWLTWACIPPDTEITKSVTSLSTLRTEICTVWQIESELTTNEVRTGRENVDDDLNSCDFKVVKLEFPVAVELENIMEESGDTYPLCKSDYMQEKVDVKINVSKIHDLKESVQSSSSPDVSKVKKGAHYRKNKSSHEGVAKETLETRSRKEVCKVPRAKRKGVQYGQMYDKLKLSSRELSGLREAERNEASFAGATLKCETCITAFRCEAMLKKHNSVQHSEKLANVCAVCRKRFGTKADRERHQRGHYFCYKCKKCGLPFLERDAACRHYKKDEHIHDNKMTTSENPTSNEYIKHPSIHKDFRCHICNRMFTFKGYFTKHMLNHGRKPQHQCDICNKSFEKKACLTVHMLIHTGEKPHRCNICNKQFSRKPNLKQHMTVHTQERQHQCEICSKCFSQRGTLVQHMVTHTGEKAHRCEVCSKCFTLKTGLKRHMLYHTGDLPFRCDICRKGFPVKSNLELHMLTHTGEKPYQCNVCCKRFPLKATLKQHMILHSFHPRNQCDVCKKCFTQAKSLRLHLMTHTGERPYGCETCGKHFSYVHTLQQHTLTHTGEQPYGCDICSRRFALKANMKKHVTKVHKVEQSHQTHLTLAMSGRGN